MGGPVLLLAGRYDATASAVASSLRARGATVAWADTGDFPTTSSFTATLDDGWVGRLHPPDGPPVDLDDVRAVYVRRPQPYSFHTGMSAADRRFAEAEAGAGFLGVLTSLECLWVNHPTATAAAGYKPAQLRQATTCGLTPPATLVTNDPGEVRKFVADLPGPVVYKTLTGGAPTRQVDPVEVDESVRLTAHMFQERIDKTHDVRLTVVGDRMFAVEVRTPESRLDWRTSYHDHTYTVVDAPPPVRSGVATLMERFGLTFAAVDFAVDRDGTWRFLEINPAGQWAWIEQGTGLPIADTIAGLLAKGNRD